MAATASLADELAARGFRSVLRWPRGVDARLFRPRRDASLGLLRPVFLTVGRLSLKKNLAAFLALDLPGTKVVVGEGPALTELARRCPKAIFLGAKDDADLARIYAAADVFVFPGRTDTCGLAMLEALACGVPVAGFPVAATRDVIGDAPVAVLDEDLRAACLDALALSRDACRAFAETMSWEESARCFLANLERAGSVARAPDPLRTLIPAPAAARVSARRPSRRSAERVEMDPATARRLYASCELSIRLRVAGSITRSLQLSTPDVSGSASSAVRSRTRRVSIASRWRGEPRGLLRPGERLHVLLELFRRDRRR